MLSIIERGKVCHLALIDSGFPYVVPLNYGADLDGELPVFYFHSAKSGKKIDCIRSNPSGCLAIDVGHELVTGETACEWSMNYASVIARGKLEIVEDPGEKKKGLDLLMRQYSGRTGFSFDPKEFAMTAVIKMTVSEITAKRKA